MGRPRTPTALKLVKGTAQKCRTNPREPAPERGIPAPPEHLSAAAAQAWPRVARILDRMGVLTRADGLALEGLCEAYAELIEARGALKERGEKTYAGKGMIRAYPEVAMVADADRRFRGWLASMGATPSDRTKVVSTPDTASDPWDEL